MHSSVLVGFFFRLMVSGIKRTSPDLCTTYWSARRSQASMTTSKWAKLAATAEVRSANASKVAAKQDTMVHELKSIGADVLLAITDNAPAETDTTTIQDGNCESGSSSSSGGSILGKRSITSGIGAVGFFVNPHTDELDWYPGRLYREAGVEHSFIVMYEDGDSESGLSGPMLPYVLTGGGRPTSSSVLT